MYTFSVLIKKNKHSDQDHTFRSIVDRLTNFCSEYADVEDTQDFFHLVNDDSDHEIPYETITKDINTLLSLYQANKIEDLKINTLHIDLEARYQYFISRSGDDKKDCKIGISYQHIHDYVHDNTKIAIHKMEANETSIHTTLFIERPSTDYCYDINYFPGKDEDPAPFKGEVEIYWNKADIDNPDGWKFVDEEKYTREQDSLVETITDKMSLFIKENHCVIAALYEFDRLNNKVENDKQKNKRIKM